MGNAAEDDSLEERFADVFRRYQFEFEEGFEFGDFIESSAREWLERQHEDEPVFAYFSNRINAITGFGRGGGAVKSHFKEDPDEQTVAVPDPAHERRCVECGALQFATLHGWCCENGHGGAPGIDRGGERLHGPAGEYQTRDEVDLCEFGWVDEHRDWFELEDGEIPVTREEGAVTRHDQWDSDDEHGDGIFTRGGRVQCHPCHGRDFGRNRISERKHEEGAKPKSREEYADGDRHVGVAKCHSCGDEVWTSETVAMLDELQRRVEGFEMIQSGGMVPAGEYNGSFFGTVGVHADNLSMQRFPSRDAHDHWFMPNQADAPEGFDRDEFELETLNFEGVDELVEYLRDEEE